MIEIETERLTLKKIRDCS